MAIIDKDIDKEPKWYSLRVFVGYENVAKLNLENTIEKYDLQNRIFDIVIPMEDVLVEKRGKKVLVPKKTMPGYLLVKMLYGDDIWHAVIHTQYINSFVGPKGRPVPITDEEAIHFIKLTLKTDNILSILNYNHEKRNELINEIYKIKGISVKQMCRILGLDKNVIYRAIKEKLI